MTKKAKRLSSDVERLVIPPCLGIKEWTPDGYDYDCEYNELSCDNCICVTAKYNDYTGIDPRTNKKFKAV